MSAVQFPNQLEQKNTLDSSDNFIISDSLDGDKTKKISSVNILQGGTSNPIVNLVKNTSLTLDAFDPGTGNFILTTTYQTVIQKNITTTQPNSNILFFPYFSSYTDSTNNNRVIVISMQKDESFFQGNRKISINLPSNGSEIGYQYSFSDFVPTPGTYTYTFIARIDPGGSGTIRAKRNESQCPYIIFPY